MSEQPKQIGFLWLGLASLAVAGLGLVSAGLWIPAIMMFDAPGSLDEPGVVAFALYSSSGPLAAAAGLLTGWVRAFQGARLAGLKWMIVIPVVWMVGLIGWIVLVGAVCNDSFSCGL